MSALSDAGFSYLAEFAKLPQKERMVRQDAFTRGWWAYRAELQKTIDKYKLLMETVPEHKATWKYAAQILQDAMEGIE